MTFFQKTGGLKMQVGKKNAYGYLAAAVSFSLVLMALAGYSIWYSSSIFQKLSAPTEPGTVQDIHFSLQQAQDDARLKAAGDWMQSLQNASSTASSTPLFAPTPKR